MKPGRCDIVGIILIAALVRNPEWRDMNGPPGQRVGGARRAFALVLSAVDG